MRKLNQSLTLLSQQGLDQRKESQETPLAHHSLHLYFSYICLLVLYLCLFLFFNNNNNRSVHRITVIIDPTELRMYVLIQFSCMKFKALDGTVAIKAQSGLSMGYLKAHQFSPLIVQILSYHFRAMLGG